MALIAGMTVVAGMTRSANLSRKILTPLSRCTAGRNKKKAPNGAFFVLTALIFLFGSYLLQFLGLDYLAIQCCILGAMTLGN